MIHMMARTLALLKILILTNAFHEFQILVHSIMIHGLHALVLVEMLIKESHQMHVAMQILVKQVQQHSVLNKDFKTNQITEG